jgi:hypothetical protein
LLSPGEIALLDARVRTCAHSASATASWRMFSPAANGVFFIFDNLLFILQLSPLHSAWWERFLLPKYTGANIAISFHKRNRGTQLQISSLVICMIRIKLLGVVLWLLIFFFKPLLTSD